MFLIKCPVSKVYRILSNELNDWMPIKMNASDSRSVSNPNYNLKGSLAAKRLRKPCYRCCADVIQMQQASVVTGGIDS